MKQVFHKETGLLLYEANVRTWAGYEFTGLNLCNADFAKESIRNAVFTDCSVKLATFMHAGMRGVEFHNCEGYRCNFAGADMRRCIIRGPAITEPSLYKRQWFSHSTFNGADLTGADLSQVRLASCVFDDCLMARVDVGELAVLSRFRSSSFQRVSDLPEAIAASVPVLPRGEFKGWKKCQNGRVVELIIPSRARRSAGLATKVRASYAVPVRINSQCGAGRVCKRALSLWHVDGEPCEYVVGATIRADKWDRNPWKVCAHGIHFFLTRQEAIDFNL